MRDPRQRFTTRVDNYVRFRPSYPDGVADLLRLDCGLPPEARIADVGSGTGILSGLLLRHGYRVWGVEPNPAMREAAERILAGHPRFTSVDGSAEATTLAPSSMDCLTAGQAFHWFDPVASRREFERILRPEGWVVLAWNERREGTPFLRDYARLVEAWSTETRVGDGRLEFFGPGGMSTRSFENVQPLDLESLRGRLLSSSYTPQEGDARYQPMLDELEALFRAHEENGLVAIEYDTRVYYGRLG